MKRTEKKVKLKCLLNEGTTGYYRFLSRRPLFSANIDYCGFLSFITAYNGLRASIAELGVTDVPFHSLFHLLFL
jgi:hypothetical protein